MTEIEIIESLISKFATQDMNEADTRFQLIDTILVDVLKWPKETISSEKHINGNRADYVLKKNDRPILIIESKKNGKYFDLPLNSNSEKLFQKISIEKLITDSNIKDAVMQVKEYAEDFLCPFAAICNGKVWIIFRINSQIKPWKKLPAYVIKDLEYFKEFLTEAQNLIGYEAVIKHDSISKNIGISKKTYAEFTTVHFLLRNSEIKEIG